jgi:hypothetical protein
MVLKRMSEAADFDFGDCVIDFGWSHVCLRRSIFDYAYMSLLRIN